MSVWNAVLQATHSALIDELNARFPDEKLELGLPKRFDGFALLTADAQAKFWAIRTVAEGTGFAGLAGGPKQPAKELEHVFLRMRERATKEFELRGIAAEFTRESSTPAGARMTIWLPIVIRRPKADATFDLALGVGL